MFSECTRTLAPPMATGRERQAARTLTSPKPAALHLHAKFFRCTPEAAVGTAVQPGLGRDGDLAAFSFSFVRVAVGATWPGAARSAPPSPLAGFRGDGAYRAPRAAVLTGVLCTLVVVVAGCGGGGSGDPPPPPNRAPTAASQRVRTAVARRSRWPSTPPRPATPTGRSTATRGISVTAPRAPDARQCTRSRTPAPIAFN